METKLEVFRDCPDKVIFLEQCNNLGEKLMKLKTQVRHTTNDLGSMKIVGKGIARGKMVTYKAGKSDEVRHCMQSLSDIAANYYSSIRFSEDIESIRECNTTTPPKQLQKLFCSSIVQSHNLVNAAHYDLDKSI